MRIDSEGLGIRPVESFDERLGGERSTPGGARFDPRGFVHFVAEGRHLTPSACDDPADVSRRSPVQSEAEGTSDSGTSLRDATAASV
jgi:hypothetical protein